jgi:hypothetical protein
LPSPKPRRCARGSQRRSGMEAIIQKRGKWITAIAGLGAIHSRFNLNGETALSGACANCMDCSATNAVQPHFPLGGTPIGSSPRQWSNRKGRREMASCLSSRPAPTTALFSKKSRAHRGPNAALSADRFHAMSPTGFEAARASIRRWSLIASRQKFRAFPMRPTAPNALSRRMTVVM